MTISCAICAYNAEGNIESLLGALRRQKVAGFREIIVYSDQSRDSTVASAQKVSRKTNRIRIKIIDAPKRGGFAQAVRFLLSYCAGDIVILLNDDIQITDRYFIKKLIAPFFEDSSVGLVCGNPRFLKPQTFVEKAAISSIRAYEAMRLSLKNGHNIFACDGKIMALSRSFIEKLKLPPKNSQMGNVDAFLYFSCLRSGFKFLHQKEAKVFYRCPSSIKDYLAWTVRNNANFHLLREEFGALVEKEFQKPKLKFLRYLFWEFIKNPLGCLFIFTFRFYIGLRAKAHARNFPVRWETLATSKRLGG